MARRCEMCELREALIEAGARTLFKVAYDRELWWKNAEEAHRQHYRNDAEAVLDAMLDKLEEHADEWRIASGAGPVGSGQDYGYKIEYIPDLLSVLRVKP